MQCCLCTTNECGRKMSDCSNTGASEKEKSTTAAAAVRCWARHRGAERRDDGARVEKGNVEWRSPCA